MHKNTYQAIIISLALISIPCFAYAADVESWFKSEGNKTADTVAVTQSANVSDAVVENKAENVERPIVTNKNVSKVISSGSAHSLDEIIFKISRAQSNLEGYGSDLNGHGSKAIEYLKQALEELKQAR